MRVLPDVISFSKFVLDLGNRIPNDNADNINLLLNCINKCVVQNQSIVNKIFEDFIRNKRFYKMNLSAILSSRNVDDD